MIYKAEQQESRQTRYSMEIVVAASTIHSLSSSVVGIMVYTLLFSTLHKKNLMQLSLESKGEISQVLAIQFIILETADLKIL
jgi:hypothetical protein